MRFFALATAFMGALSAVTASANPGTSDADERSLFSRATGNVCITVPNLVVLTINTGSVCICATAGVVNPTSVANAAAGIQANGGVLGLLLPLLLPGVLFPSQTQISAALLSTLGPVLQAAFNNAPQPTCTYPANSTPSGCSANNDCSVFTCNAQFIRCGDVCVAGTVCPTPGRKRGLGSLEDIRRDLRCPLGFDACTVPTFGQSTAHKGRDFECIQTHRDLESCGGCMFPLAGQAQGNDCTSIAESTSVSCHAGKCVVHSCAPGFAPNGSTCARTGTGRKSKGDGAFWSALEVLVARKQDERQ